MVTTNLIRNAIDAKDLALGVDLQLLVYLSNVTKALLGYIRAVVNVYHASILVKNAPVILQTVLNVVICPKEENLLLTIIKAVDAKPIFMRKISSVYPVKNPV